MQLVPSGKVLGATIEALDLSAPLRDAEVDFIVEALGCHGVLLRGELIRTMQLCGVSDIGGIGPDLLFKKAS